MIENDAIQIVLSSLSSPVRQERIDSLYWLMYRSHPLIAPAVIPLLRDKDAEIRRLAVEVLGENRDRDSVSALRDVLSDRDPRVREAAATALGKLGDHDIVPPLLKLLEDPVTRVRTAAAGALGKIGDPRAIKALVRAMERSDEPAAIASAQALLALGTPEALTAIARFRVGDDYEFRFEHAPKMAERDETTRGGIPPEMMPGSEVAPPMPRPAASAGTDIQFSAFYPKEVAPSVWMPLRAYVYRAGEAEAVNADARKELGALMAINSARYYQETAALPGAHDLGALPLEYGLQLGAQIKTHLPEGGLVMADVDGWTLNSLAGMTFDFVREARAPLINLIPAQGGLYVAATPPEHEPPSPLGASLAAQIALPDGWTLSVDRFGPGAALPDDAVPFEIAGDYGMALAGYALERTDDDWLLTTYWRVSARAEEIDQSLFAPFAHLFDADGARIAVIDGAAVPGYLWRVGDLHAHRMRFTPPADAAAPLTIAVGQYDALKGTNIIFTVDGAASPLILLALPLP